MKFFIFLVLITMSLQACARGAKRPDYDVRAERKEQDKAWAPCKDNEDPEPVGKFCNAVCIKVKFDGQCKEWKINKKNYSNKEEFLFFRNGGFILIDEDNL